MFSRNRGLFIVTILALIGVAFVVRSGQAQKPTSAKAPAGKHAQLANHVATVGHAVGFAETRPVREIMAEINQVDFELKQQVEEMNELNTVFNRKPNPHAPAQKDGALQSSFGTDGHFHLNIPTPILVFEGVGVTNSAPPDTEGAVGPNDYVQVVNGGGVRIFDKNGVPRGPAFKLSTLFAGLGGVVATNDNGDGLALYDRMANRWVLSQFAFTSTSTPPYHQAIAVSKTGDPTGEYWAYDFVTPGDEFPDYGKIGAWSDGYYFTDRQFTFGGAYNGFGCFAFDRAKMLVGDSSASYVYFSVDPSVSDASSGMIPSDYNGLNPPPAGAPNVFSVFLDDAYGIDPFDALRLFDFHADFDNPMSSTFLERPESPLAVASFDSRNPNGRADVEEPAPATSVDYLDTIGDRLMLRLQYFNRGGTETLTTVCTVNSGIIPPPGGIPTVAEYRAGTRWYVLQKTSPGGNWSIQDQGTFSPDTTERWMGSSAVDNAGNLAVGYSTSSTSVFPSIAYAGRLLGDPAGTLSQGEETMFAGTGVQLGTGNRWGDYSAMCLDPSDDATFWYTSEYYNTSPAGGFDWKTKIGAFKFEGTTAPPQGTLSGTITACDTGEPIKDALVEVTGGPSTGFSAGSKPDGTYSMNLSPGSYSATIIDPAHNCDAIGPFPVVITDGNTATLDECLSGVAGFVFDSTTVSESGGNGNGMIEPSECNNLDVSILNDGCLLGSGVSAVLSTTTPEVTISQPNSDYPDTPENGTATNATPFQVSTSPAFQCGTMIDFTLTVSFAGGSSVLNFSLPSCEIPPAVINGVLDDSDTVEEGRLGRNGLVSGCGTAKTCPGIFGTGNRRYDVLTFPNGPAAACATITTTATNTTSGGAILSVAYLNQYIPPVVGMTDNICINYLGDPGGSPAFNTSNTFSVDIPANQTLVVVVEETNAMQTPGSTYTLEVSGLVGNGVGPGPCTMGGNLVSAASRLTHGGAGSFDVDMPLAGTSGVEDRNGGGTYLAVFTFDTAVTSGDASVISGTATAGTPTFSGNEMRVPLMGVADEQVVTIEVSNVNGGGGSNDVDFGFLIGDVNGSRAVTRNDVRLIRDDKNQGVNSGNFREDITLNGVVDKPDRDAVKATRGHSIP